MVTHRTLREIGEKLFISRSTIKTQVSSIYAKLAVNSRDEAVAILQSDARYQMRTPRA